MAGSSLPSRVTDGIEVLMDDKMFFAIEEDDSDQNPPWTANLALAAMKGGKTAVYQR
jgi:hypothetical protein